ncbi:MAG TPA: hydrogenase maturation nickel metallochaperone HypA [Desulfomonilia bacterium]|jgi:hydrogenase nickel incorporation protein HypA/HybF
MHEMSLVQSIIEIINEYAKKENFKKVESISLSFGKASTVVPAALEFAFEVLSEGTVAQGARLEFDIKPVVIYCLSCEKDFKMDSYEAACPQCKGGEIMLTGGTEELKLIEMEVV